ncbi:insulinase family protein [Halomonas sp. C05BenzN]|uniref:insulinase family protein n=1 Tax=Halomonas sp. C05BenzN TaxID=3411041 RepID=UPI003B963EC6
MIHTPPGDRRRCRSLTLPNGLRVLLLRDPDADQAGAAMSVGAGSGDEPPDRAGLAHLLEHMLFLGTDRYPAPEDFPAYVQGHGGRYNATTELHQTCYFFEVPPAHLGGALDRFAQFFIAPRLTESAIAQEREVIDAEYRARRGDDEQRILGVIKQVLDPAHPASRFLAGNRDTLGEAPEALRRALMAFRQRHYTAANLRLAVVGNEPLDTLERQVRRCFADIPPGTMPAPAAHPPLLPPGSLPLGLALQPTHRRHELRLCFPVPALRPDDYLQPWAYLGELLAFRGPGSLYGQLMDRGWLTGIDGSVLLDTRPQALFQIRLRLTPDGMGHTAAITAAVFACLRRIGTDGIAAWRHRERQVLADQRFRLAATTSTLEFVKSLADQLHRYPVAEALRGPYRLDAFQPRVIRDCLAHLTPDNLLTLTVDPAVRGDRTSPWFPAPYRVAAAPDPGATRWDGAPDFTLPPPNPFLVTIPHAEPGGPSAAVPRLLHDSGQSRVWHQPLARAPGGRTGIHLNLVAACPTHTLGATVLTALLIAWLERELAAEWQQARAAGMEVTPSRHHQGITLRASGLPEQLDRLLQRLSSCLSRTRITAERFDQARQGLQACWEAQQHDLAFRRLLRLPEARLGHGFDDEERLAELATVSLERLQVFRDELLHGVGIDCLVAGPLDGARARRLVAGLEARLLAGEASAVERRRPPIVSLQAGQAYHYRLEASHPDSAVALYLPGPDGSPLQEARYRLLAALLHDAFFHRLRIEQQLGYVVLARYLPLHDCPGLILLVQSPSLSVDELQRRIRHFLTAPDAPLPRLDPERFAHYRDGLLHALQAQQRQPAQQMEQFWASLAAGDADFQRPRQLLQAVTDLTLEELQRFYQAQLLPSPWVWLHT